MKVEFKKSFLKDLKKLKSKSLRDSVYNSIIQAETAKDIQEIRNLKKLVGFESHYRIRVGDYRIGIFHQNEVIIFVVFEHRKDVYKKFP